MIFFLDRFNECLSILLPIVLTSFSQGLSLDFLDIQWRRRVTFLALTCRVCTSTADGLVPFVPPYIQRRFPGYRRYFPTVLKSLYLLQVIINALYNILAVIGHHSVACSFEDAVFWLVGHAKTFAILVRLNARFQTFDEILIVKRLMECREEYAVVLQLFIFLHYFIVIVKVYSVYTKHTERNGCRIIGLASAWSTLKNYVVLGFQ